MSELLKKAREQLTSKGFKWTEPRSEIISLLSEQTDAHVSAEELYELLQKKRPDIGLATVYRTLDLLAELGFAHKLNFGDGCSRYEVADSSHHHHHLICSACGKVEEVPMDLLEQLEQEIESEYNFEIHGHHLKFFGRCGQCCTKGKE
ncbi:MAG: transcriptional repressor [Firmicutes bacterium]|nr:transcriptional repressor [Bacillota bacterium]